MFLKQVNSPPPCPDWSLVAPKILFAKTSSNAVFPLVNNHYFSAMNTNFFSLFVLGNLVALCSGAVSPNWTSLGGLPGTNGKVYDILSWGDSVVVAGAFSAIADQSVSNAALWNGSSWSPMGMEPSQYRTYLAKTSSNTLFSIGYDPKTNTNPGADDIGWLEYWNGSSWVAASADYNFASVRSLIVDSKDQIWIAGYYYATGTSKKIEGLLRWDGKEWMNMSNVAVYGLELGTEGQVYATGIFSSIGGIEARNIAMYSNSTWSPMGTGLNKQGRQVMVNNLGQVHVLGSFDSAGTVKTSMSAYWNGTDWKEGAMGGYTSSFMMKDSKGKIYLKHYYNILAYLPPAVNYLGHSGFYTLLTQTLNSTNSATYECLAESKQGDIWVGGTFNGVNAAGTDSTLAKAYFSNNLAVLRQGTWQSISNGLDQPIHQFVKAPDQSLLAVGMMNVANGKTLNKVGLWDGTKLNAIGPYVTGATPSSIDVIHTAAYDAKGTLYVGGSFTANTFKNVAYWTGSEWIGCPGLSSTVHRILADKSGTVYAATDEGVWAWNKTTWSRLGTVDEISGAVYDLAWGPDSSLWAAGDISMEAGTSSLGLAKWDGQKWIPQGIGVNGKIYSIQVLSDGTVYAGGDFRYAYTKSIQDGNSDILWLNYVGKWNGSKWTRLGEGVNGVVRSLVVDTQGNLMIGGNFTGTNIALGGIQETGHLALWSHNQWNSIGVGTDGPVLSMGFDKNGKLLVSGEFSKAGGSVSAKWAMLDYQAYILPLRDRAINLKSNQTPHHRFTLKGERL